MHSRLNSFLLSPTQGPGKVDRNSLGRARAPLAQVPGLDRSLAPPHTPLLAEQAGPGVCEATKRRETGAFSNVPPARHPESRLRPAPPPPQLRAGNRDFFRGQLASPLSAALEAPVAHRRQAKRGRARLGGKPLPAHTGRPPHSSPALPAAIPSPAGARAPRLESPTRA